jgi:hypothetical protein
LGFEVYSGQVLSDPQELEEKLYAMLDIRVEGIFIIGTAGTRFLEAKPLMYAAERGRLWF